MPNNDFRTWTASYLAARLAWWMLDMFVSGAVMALGAWTTLRAVGVL